MQDCTNERLEKNTYALFFFVAEEAYFEYLARHGLYASIVAVAARRRDSFVLLKTSRFIVKLIVSNVGDHISFLGLIQHLSARNACCAD